MRVLEAGDWSLLLPEEWSAERDEDIIVIGDQDDVGVLEISELHKDEGEFSAADVASIAEDSGALDPVKIGSFSGVYTYFVEEDAALREWYLYAEDLLLYITYSCDLDNQGLDDAIVDDILATLRFCRD